MPPENYHDIVLEAEKVKGFWELEEAYRILKKIGGVINEDAGLSADWSMDGISLWESCFCDFQTYTFSKVLREIFYADYLIKNVQGDELGLFRQKNASGLKNIDYSNVFYESLDFLCSKRGIKVRSESQKGFLKRSRERLVLFARPYIKMFYNFIRSLRIRYVFSETGAKGDIWFFNNLGRTLDTVLPVAKELKKRGIEPIILQYSDDGFARLKNSEVKVVRLEGLTGIGDIFGWFLWAIKVKRMVRRLFSDDKVKASLSSHGVPLVVVAGKELATGMRMTLEGLYPMRLWLKRSGCLNGRAIVSTTERSNFCRLLALMAGERGIPFIVLQNGILPDHPKWLPALVCDRMAVEGRKVSEILVGKGHPTEKIMVTGQPKYDELKSRYRAGECRRKICERYSLDTGKKLVVFASNQMNESVPSQSRVEAGQNILRANEFRVVYSLPFQLTDIQLIIKPHPNEDLSAHERLLAEVSHNSVRLALKPEDTYALVAASDLVIIHRSTVGLDALVLGKPLLVFNLTGEEDLIPYVKYGAAVGVYDRDSFTPSIEAVLKRASGLREKLDAGREVFIKDFAHKIDGGASARMADVILNHAARPINARMQARTAVCD